MDTIVRVCTGLLLAQQWMGLETFLNKEQYNAVVCIRLYKKRKKINLFNGGKSHLSSIEIFHR